MVSTVSIDQFRSALANFAAGVTVVTSTDSDGTPVGATVSAFASVSADPPLVLVCLKSSTRSAQAVSESGAYTVHILDTDQAELASRFAADLSDKFAGLEYHIGGNGCPVIDHCSIRLECEVETQVAAGTHTIFVGSVKEIHAADINPLVYANRSFGEVRALGSPNGS